MPIRNLEINLTGEAWLRKRFLGISDGLLAPRMLLKGIATLAIFPPVAEQDLAPYNSPQNDFFRLYRPDHEQT
ncbi:hypothetical protein [Rhodopirellula sp. MGV]|uniref:hypothetical protein n=1 Tax=Rhodopirellula sp. MGV TaxID=2023130 RepID=UPI00117B5695|nr:hypothetical protein [Rhodopirellula sp. MGV]